MPTTPNLGLRYPAGTNAVDVVTDLSNLANDVDTVVYPKLPYLARQTLGGSAASVTFANIPSNLRSVRIRWSARTDNAVQTQIVFCRVNSDAGANYNTETVQANNITASGGYTGAGTSWVVGQVLGSSTPANSFASGVIDVLGWDLTGRFLPMNYTSEANGSGGGNSLALSGGGLYFVTGPWTSLTLFPNAGNFVALSDFQLEGWPT